MLPPDAYVYDGGVLTSAECAAITPCEAELAGFAFVGPPEVAALVTPLAGRRIAACLDAVANATVASLEDGRPAGAAGPGR